MLSFNVLVFLNRGSKTVLALGSLALLCTTVSAAAPLNNSFQNALVVSGIQTNYAGNIAGASRDSSDPFWIEDPAGASRTGDKTVWFKWTAPADGPVAISTGIPDRPVSEQSQFDTQLGVYVLNDPDGGESPFNLRTISGSEDAPQFSGTGGSSLSWVEFDGTLNTTYYIMVAQFAPPEDQNETYILYIKQSPENGGEPEPVNILNPAYGGIFYFGIPNYCQFQVSSRIFGFSYNHKLDGNASIHCSRHFGD